MSKSQEPIIPILPYIGKSRWRNIAPFVPVSRETFRQLSLAGRAPKHERISERCTFFDNREVHRWLADPLNYRAPGFNGEAEK